MHFILVYRNIWTSKSMKELLDISFRPKLLNVGYV